MSIYVAGWAVVVGLPTVVAVTVGGGVWLGRRSTAGRHRAELAEAGRLARFAARRAWFLNQLRGAVTVDLSDAYDVYGDDPPADPRWSR